MRDDSRELATLWVNLAETDVAVAKRLLPDLIDPAAFHIQQAIEKLLKAAIVLSGREPPKIHDLKRLLALAKDDLSWSEPESWLGEKSDWNSVTRYGATDIVASPTLEDVEQSFDSTDRLLIELRQKSA